MTRVFRAFPRSGVCGVRLHDGGQFGPIASASIRERGRLVGVKIAALFPGQGSQAVGMTKELFEHNDSARALLERAFQVLPGLDHLMFEGPEDALKLTENAQPALVAAGVACYRAWRAATNLTPDYAAGHSLGEFAALVAARALEFDDALRLVRARGHYMQQAVPVGEGAMAAVLKVSLEMIQEVIATIEGAEIANLNTPEQTVISGTTAGVQTASDALKAKGARVIALQVSAPFHSSMMQPARARLEKDLAATDFHDFYFPVVANVTAEPNTDATQLPTLLSKQVTSSVRWVESVQQLWNLGAREFIEFGPGAVLTGMVKRILPEATTFNISSPETLKTYLATRM
jgi:[acyl-carrier-protein] S-malonyltransferase